MAPAFLPLAMINYSPTLPPHAASQDPPAVSEFLKSCPGTLR